MRTENRGPRFGGSARSLGAAVLLGLGGAAGLVSACNLILSNQVLEGDGGSDAEKGSERVVGQDSPQDSPSDRGPADARPAPDAARDAGSDGASMESAVCGMVPRLEGGAIQVMPNFCEASSPPPSDSGASFFCDDFERSDASVLGPWSSVGADAGGLILLSPASYVSPGYALHAEMFAIDGAATNGGVNLKYDFGFAGRATFEFDAHINAWAAQDDSAITNIATIAFDDSGNDNHIDVRLMPGALAFFEKNKGGSVNGPLGDGGPPIASGEWVRVSITVSLGTAPTVNIKVTDLCLGTGLWLHQFSLASMFKPSAGDISVGFTYVSFEDGGGAQSVYIDNVTLVTDADAG